MTLSARHRDSLVWVEVRLRQLLSGVGCSVGFVFESMFDIDPGASQAELRARVEEFERVKSAAAAAQARRDGVVGRQTPGC